MNRSSTNSGFWGGMFSMWGKELIGKMMISHTMFTWGVEYFQISRKIFWPQQGEFQLQHIFGIAGPWESLDTGPSSVLWFGRWEWRISSSFCLTDHRRKHFSRMHSKGSRFTLGSGGWGCVRSTLPIRSQPSATVRARPVWPCLWRVLQKGSLLEVSNVA